MEKKDLTNILAEQNTTIIDAMKLIDLNSKGILMVIDENMKMLGTITDGDIRRAILAEKSVKTSIENLYNKQFIYAYENDSLNDIKKLFIENKIRVIPILNKNKELINYYEMDDLIDFHKIEKENTVLIMAGGLGTRLKPLTNDIPKPMLKVGDKPILQTIIEQFREYGFGEFIISLNYKAEVIENYFRDGRDLGVSIKYIKESKRLGTAGAIKLAENYLDKPFFVINGDILTNINFYNLLQYHVNNKFSMTIGSRIYDMQVPFGVLNISEDCVTSLKEKPIYNYIVSGGVYVLNPNVVKKIPENKYFDITELINILLKNKEKIGSFPISDYWMDIGKIEDYYKANSDIYKL